MHICLVTVRPNQVNALKLVKLTSSYTLTFTITAWTLARG